MISRALSVPVVVAVLSLFTGFAHAGEAEDIAEKCVRSMARTTARTVDHVHTIRDRGVVRIRQLDNGGASDGAITAAGERARNRVSVSGTAGAEGIHRRAQACLAKLNDLDADPALIAAVQDAASRALGRIAEVSRRSVGVINRAVENALEG